MTKRIFTFWEPKNKIPPYLKLCFKTWQKFLSDYEIVILDYSNLNEWLSDSFIKHNLKKFSLAKQSDILKCMVLKEHSGVFLDLDTIVTTAKVKDILELQGSSFTMFFPHMCYIKADKSSKTLALWEKRIKKRIEFYNKAMKSKLFLKLTNKKLYKKLNSWDFFGNGIIDKIVQNNPECLLLNRDNYHVMPDFEGYNGKVKPKNQYIDFYFKKNCCDFALQNTKGFLFLHHSKTPKKFKTLKERDFLNLDVTISSVIRTLEES